MSDRKIKVDLQQSIDLPNYTITFAGNVRGKELPMAKDSMLQNSNHIILNLETELERGTIDCLKHLGTTAVTLANDHSLHSGSDKLIRTKAMLEEAGIMTFGAGANVDEAAKPLKLICQGKHRKKNIYIFGALQRVKPLKAASMYARNNAIGVNLLDRELFNNIKTLREKDPEALIIVFPHWGANYKWLSQRKVNIGRKLILQGANIIIGHGPQMMQGFETSESNILIRSLGNYFPSSNSTNKKLHNCIVRLELFEKPGRFLVVCKLYPYFSKPRSSSIVATPFNEEDVYSLLRKLMRRYEPEKISKSICMKKDSLGWYFQFCNDSDSVTMSSDSKIAEFNNKYNFDSRLIATEFLTRGYKVNWLDNSTFLVKLKGMWTGFYKTQSTNTSFPAHHMVKDRVVSNKILAGEGINVPQGRAFVGKDIKLGVDYAISIGFPVIITSVVRSKKHRITAKNMDEFKVGWKYIVDQGKDVWVEKLANYKYQARFLVVGGECVAVSQSIPPTVIGNGFDSVTVLIANKNKDRLANPYFKSSLISRENAYFRIGSDSSGADEVPARGQHVFLFPKNDNFLLDTQDITEDVHEFYKQVAEKAAKSIFGLDILGLDIKASSFNQPGDYIVDNITSAPGIFRHYFPVFGQAVPVAKHIVSHALNLVKPLTKTKEYYLLARYFTRIIIKNIRFTSSVSSNCVLPQNKYAQSEMPTDDYNLISQIIFRELRRLGVKSTWVNHALFYFQLKGRYIGCRVSYTPGTSTVGKVILRNKAVSKEIFKSIGISVAKGKYYIRDDWKSASSYFKTFRGPVVIKPVDGLKAKGVSVGVKYWESFNNAWKQAKRYSKKGIIIEEQFKGTEARFFVIGSKCVAAFRKINPHIVGNGKQTIEELVQEKQKNRSQNPHLFNRPLIIGDHQKNILKEQGYCLNSIPPDGQKVIIDWNASSPAGGETFDITDVVHPSYKLVVERLASIISGIDIIGVDMLAKDYNQPADKDNYIVLEANTQPGLGGHHFPVYGKRRNVGRLVAKHIIRSVNKRLDGGDINV